MIGPVTIHKHLTSCKAYSYTSDMIEKKHLGLLGICFFFLTSFNVFAQDPNFHIYLCFGQSNMEGAGAIEAQDRTSDDRFRVMGAVNCTAGSKSYTLGRWHTASPPLTRCNTQLGPADYFGKTMIANLPANIKVGVVPVAIGGCDIALFDKVNYASYVATAPDWMRGSINLYGGNPYARLIEVAKIAQKEGVIKGILLHQGETNNGQSTWPAKVKEIYDNLIRDLGLNPAQTPLLIGELVTSAEGGACGLHNTVIARTPSVIPNAHVVSASGLPHNGDRLHFTSASYRVLGQRYAQKMLSLLPDLSSPAIRFTKPSNGETLVLPGPVKLEVAANVSDGSIVNVKFYNENTLLYTDNTAPYSYDWVDATAGRYEIRAIATDNKGRTSENKVTIRINPPQTPYGGMPHKIPGTIQLEEFDHGGNGFAYYDDTHGSQVSPVVNFRTDEDVDIEVCSDTGGGYNVGWATSGEWLEYTVNVEAAGTYDLELRVACNGAGRAVTVAMDGTSTASNVSIPNTGGWQAWQTVHIKDIELNAGIQTLRLTIGDIDYVNLNYLIFKDVDVSIPPEVSLSSPMANSTYTILETVKLTADAYDADGSISSVDFYSGPMLLGSVNSSPYTINWSGMQAGVHSITAVATDNKGIKTSSSPVNITVKAVQAPYHGIAHVIPGRIEAEEYDLGGEGLGYHEVDANGNQGGAPFRNDEVDIEITKDEEGGYNVGYVLAGEWLQYTVEIVSSGIYDLDLRMAADGAGKTLHIEIDGTDVTGSVIVPNTGGWQAWQTVTVNNLSLTAGEHIMRIVFESSYMNLNYIEFQDLITGFSNDKLSAINIYPMPFTDTGFTIKHMGSFGYQIISPEGILLEEGAGMDEQIAGIDLSGGIYMLVITDGYDSKRTKIIKY